MKTILVVEDEMRIARLVRDYLANAGVISGYSDNTFRPSNNATRGQFSNPGGSALNADGLTVDQDMFCSEGFSATGEVRLPGAHIGGMLYCEAASSPILTVRCSLSREPL